MSIAAGKLPTVSELQAHSRRIAFRLKIAEAAAALKAKRETALAPEAMPAEPDPPPARSADASALALVWPFMPPEPIEVRVPSPMKVRVIQEAVCRVYDVTLNDLCSSRRHALVVRPRQVAMYLCKVLTPRSYPEIGRGFGGRDHTTVLHAVRKISAKVEFNMQDPNSFDAELHDIVNALRAELEARRG